jgi:hypothetical protein
MNLSNRWLVVGVTLTVSLIGAGCLYFAPKPRLRPWYQAEQEERVQVERKRAERLRVKQAELWRRREATAAVVSAVIDGRQTLWEAAARLGRLERDIVDAQTYQKLLRDAFPGDSVEECLCLKVIACVRERAARQPRLAETVRRLEEELAQQRRRHRRIRLSEVPADGMSPD